METGIITGIIVGLGTLLVAILPRRGWWIASLLMIIIIPLTLVGFWPNGQWGISDWDYYFSYHTAIHRIVTQHRVFPQWNPYICGGTSAIGDPEFPLFAPTFLLELIFGIPNGLRLAIFPVMAFGAVGMLLLARRLGLSPPAGLLATLAFSLGSINLLEIVEGHPNVFSAFYLPWIFWNWLMAYGQSTKSYFWSLLCGLFLALTFFQGGIYMLMYLGFAFLFLIATLPHHRHALKITIIAGLWAVGVAAIKLVPVLLWLQQFQDRAYASSTYLLPSLHKILLGRYLHGSENVIPNQGSGWHEYGAYIGIIVLVSALVSLARLKDKRVRLLWLGTVLAILIASAGPLLKPLFDQAPFLPRSNISRFMIMAILPLSFLAGFGLETLLPKWRWTAVAAAILLGAATFDLAGYAAALSQQAFILNPTPSVASPPSPIAYTINQHITRVNGVDYSRAYAGARVGYGTLSYCSVLGPESAVRVIEDPEGSPYLTVHNTNGHAELVSWTPNQIQVKATLNEPGEVVVNSNYVVGWWVNDQPATDNGNRLAAALPVGIHDLTFTYRAPGLLHGAIVTFLTLLGAAAYLVSFLYHKVHQART